MSTTKTTKSTDKFWADDEANLNLFKNFINSKYDVSDSADTKFKDLMTAFSNHSGITISCIWSTKYENLCQKINLKFDKVVNPRYASQGSGTCHVFLTPKDYKPKLYPTTHNYKTGVIPDLF
jgi:hypothetical protein